MLGDTISSPTGDYQVIKILGSGSFGKVALCSKGQTDHLVALKIIDDEKSIAGSKNEANFLDMMTGLGSRNFNIVEYSGAFMSSHGLCLEFETLGMDIYEHMKAHVKDTRLSLMDIRPIMQQMAEALCFLHHINVIHADVKPENIMLANHEEEPWRAKLIDFGTALNDPENRIGHMIGTLPYTAPEMLLGAPFSHAIDIWSLGCVAVELLIGDILMAGKREAEIVRNLISLRGDVPDHVMDSGCRTNKFFEKLPSFEQPAPWSLKSIKKIQRCPIKSLAELLKVPEGTPLEDVPAEARDRALFLDLIEQMLNTDPHQRISALGVLQHPFLTLGHLDSRYDNYLQRSIKLMEVCPYWPVIGQQVLPSGNSSPEQHSRACPSTKDHLSGWKRYRDSDDPGAAQQHDGVTLRKTPECRSPPRKLRRLCTDETARKSMSEESSSQMNLRKRKRVETNTETDLPPAKKRRLDSHCHF